MRKPIQFYKDENNCFIVTSHAQTKGYPSIWRDGRTVRMSRFIYEECFGEIPKGLVVRHTCDKPACINPEHLILGTQQDNINDMLNRNRQCSLFSEKDISDIRNSHLGVRKLARKYNVHSSTISAIQLGKRWKHIKKEIIRQGTPRSKLSIEIVYLIRQSNLSKHALANMFDVSERTIRDIRSDRTWKKSRQCQKLGGWD